MKSENARLLTDISIEEIKASFPFGAFVGFVLESGATVDAVRWAVVDPLRWSVPAPIAGDLFACVYNSPLGEAEPVFYFHAGQVEAGTEVRMEGE